MHLFLSKDVDSGHTMEHEDDKDEGSTKEKNQLSVSTTSQACRNNNYEQNDFERVVTNTGCDSNITIFEDEMLSNILRGTQVSLAFEFIRCWNNFIFTRSFKPPVLNVEISSIMHLIFPLSAKKDTGTLDVCNGLKGNTSTWSLTMEQTEKVTRFNDLLSNSELMTCLPANKEREDVTNLIMIKEKPPDFQPPIKIRGNYLDSQKRMKANLLSLGADCTIFNDREIFTHHRSPSRDHHEVYQDQLQLKHKGEHIGKQLNFFKRADEVKEALFSKQPLSLFAYKEALMSLTNLAPVLPSEMMSLLQDYKDVFEETIFSLNQNAFQNHIWRPGDYLPHKIWITSLHMFPVEPKMDLSSFYSFQTYQWRPGELLLCKLTSRTDKLASNNALIKEEPPDLTPLPFTEKLLSTEHSKELIQVSIFLSQFVSHDLRAVNMNILSPEIIEKKLGLFKEYLEPKSCLRMLEKEELDKNNALIQSDTCFHVYCDSMTVITCLLFAKSVDNFAGIKEEPPDSKIISSSCFARTGIGVVLLYDKKPLPYFRMIFEVGEQVSTPRIAGPFSLTRRIINNANQLDLRGKHPMMLLFAGSNLVLFVAGQTDLRTNPFQLGEDDMILESSKDTKHGVGNIKEAMDVHGAKGAFGTLIGVKNYSITREFNKEFRVSLHLVKTQEDHSNIWRLYQVHIGHDSRSRRLVHGHMIHSHSFSLISVLSHWVFRVRFLMRLVAHMLTFAISSQIHIRPI